MPSWAFRNYRMIALEFPTFIDHLPVGPFRNTNDDYARQSHIHRDHELFRQSARFFRRVRTNIDQWLGTVREFWLKAGEKGFHCCGVPEEYGGGC